MATRILNALNGFRGAAADSAATLAGPQPGAGANAAPPAASTSHPAAAACEPAVGVTSAHPESAVIAPSPDKDAFPAHPGAVAAASYPAAATITTASRPEDADASSAPRVAAHPELATQEAGNTWTHPDRGAPVARIRDLGRAFGTRRVLGGIDLEIRRGEFVALLGRSGSGKSTLLRALAGLDAEHTGALSVAGEVAVAFQEPRLVPWRRVLANITLGLRHSEPERAARAALAEVGLAERAEVWPGTLSGGEAQRAALARALVRAPDLLLLDEPFSALDALTRITIHGLVLELWQRHRPGVLLVTHDVDEALLLADRALVLGDGRIARDLAVDLPRPRRRDHPEFLALRCELLATLGVPPEGAA